ncbi:MAG: hypothetical protein OXU20_38840 [Myxococcales bacterium]|nr:hypothetical protein [Myxococcales bacterium]MDD9967302.1 hypothetical protein [Myxococcales bacterium]
MKWIGSKRCVRAVVVIAGGAALFGCRDAGVTHVECAADPIEAGPPPAPGDGASGEGLAADGTSGSGAPPPVAVPQACPVGYQCTDLSARGLAAADGAGNPVAATCSMGAPVQCNDADPAGSCPGLPNAICVHIMAGGMEIVSCGQVCAPE